VLEVVEDQQHPLVAQRLDQELDGIGAVRRRQAQRATDQRGHACDIANACEFDEPHAVGKRIQQGGAHLMREPCLADASWARQRDEPVVPQQVADRCDGTTAADKRAGLRRQVVPLTRECAQRRELLGNALCLHLEQVHGHRQILQPMQSQIRQPDGCRETVHGQCLRGLGDEHLPAMTGVGDARGTM
jgi:uncharacterized membrane protein YccC